MLFSGIATFAQVVITPSTPPAVNQGTTFKFTANVPVTWSCPGCAGTIDADGTYHAPESVKSQQSFGGYQLLPNDHIFNTRIDSLPMNTNSATWIAGAGSHAVTFEPSFPINYRNGSTPTTSESCYFNPTQNGTFQLDDYPFGRVEEGWFIPRVAQGGGNIDVHITGIDSTSGQVQELYDLDGRPGHMTSCAKYANSTYNLPNSDGATDAGGLYLMPLTLRLQEMGNAINTGGTIKHALRMTLQNGYIANSNIWPATTNSSSGGGVVPEGARFRLKANFNISGFSPIAQILLTEMKQYGLILADGGTGWGIQTEYTRWPPEVIDAFFTITGSGLTASSFEAVDESGLEVSARSGLTTAATETVVATASGGTASQQVVLTGVTLTLAKDSINVQTGTPAQQLAYYIRGSSNTGVTFAMNPPIGTLASGGLYTPPSTDQVFTIEAQSNATATFTRAIQDLNVSATGTYPAFATTKRPGEWIDYMVALKSSGTPYGAHPVQTEGADTPTTCTNCSDAFTHGVVMGNLGVVAIYESTDATATITSAKLDCGTLVLDSNSPKRGASSSMWIYVAHFTSGGACGVSLTFSHSVTEFTYLAEYHNMATPSFIDCSVAGTGTGQIMNSGSCTTSNAADTLFSYVVTKSPSDIIQASGSTTVVTATSSADSSVSVTMKIKIFNSGSIRSVLGLPSDYVDTFGNTWHAEIGDDGCIPDNNGGGYPAVPNILLYETPCFAGNDLRFDILVPNGMYSITGKFAEYWNEGVGKRLMDLESQGSVIYSNVDIQAAVGVKMPKDYVLPANVTTGLLSFVVRHANGDGPIISALEIDPVSVPGTSALPPNVNVIDVK
jgi:hypothetical protein